MQQLLSAQTLTYLLGLALIVIGIFGGGIEVKEIKIPTLPTFSRAASLAVGIVLVVVCYAFPQAFPNGDITGALKQPHENSSVVAEKPKWLGAAIQNKVITVTEVKRILRHLGNYSGPLNEDATPEYFQAVTDFQISQNVEADGYVGPITYRKLREAWPDYFATTISAPTK